MKIQSSYTKAIIEYKKSQIIQSFSFLQNSQNDDFVSIYKFISHVPECFYSEEVFSRIRCLCIFESTVENYGLYRIEWNKKWLEQQKKS